MSRVRIRCRGGVILTVRCWPAPKFFGVDGFVFHRSLTVDLSTKRGFSATGKQIVYTYKESGYKLGEGDTEQAAIAEARRLAKEASARLGCSPKQAILAGIAKMRAAVIDGSWKDV